jgi:hypothetical protein
MKALPILLFVVAVIFAYFEWQHGRAHEAVAENAANRIKSLQVPAIASHAPPPHPMVLKKIEPGLIGTGKVAAKPGSQPAPQPYVPPTGPAPTQIATTQAEQDKDNAAVQATEGPMITMRIILTILFIPACFGIILAKNRFDDKGRGFAYTTLGVILTFWLHS